jgi:hypothetical protein
MRRRSEPDSKFINANQEHLPTAEHACADGSGLCTVRNLFKNILLFSQCGHTSYCTEAMQVEDVFGKVQTKTCTHVL